MINVPHHAMMNIEGWIKDWEEGKGSWPVVHPITFEPDIYPLRSATWTGGRKSWEIELTYGATGDETSCFLVICRSDGPQCLQKITANAIYFEADGEPGRIFRGKVRRLYP